MNLPFYTIGHSTRTLEEFVGLLRAAEVALVVDIRTVPKSRCAQSGANRSLVRIPC